MKRCGYIALIGRPNAGKSTLLNALVGDKVAVVSRRPQTTRNRILGIRVEGEAQLLFLDTPGLHRAERQHLINAMMNRIATQAAAEADVVLYLVDAAHGLTADDCRALDQIAKQAPSRPLLLIASKVDALGREQRQQALARLDLALEEHHQHRLDRGLAPLPVQRSGPKPLSAKRPEDVAALRATMAGLVPEGPWMFDEDDLTDMPRSFICSELIREQVFRQLGQEIPYGTAVRVTAVEFKAQPTGADAPRVLVRAAIVASRRSHKPILVGAGGSRIKNLGQMARESLERHFGERVYLELRVEVAEGWIDDQRLIAELAMLNDPGSSTAAMMTGDPEP